MNPRVEKIPQPRSLYRSPKNVRVIKCRRFRLAGHVVRMEEGKSAFKIITGTPTGKRSLGRRRRRWMAMLGYIVNKYIY